MEKEFEKLRKGIAEYCAQKGVSRADLAVKAGVSPATISAIETGKSKAVSMAMRRKILSVLNAELISGVMETNDLHTVFKAADFARKHRAMIGVIGDTGVGKTTALKAYARLHKNTYRVTFEKSMKTRHFLAALLREMGVSFDGNANAMLNMAADELNKTESPLLMIDEAGKMTHPVLLCLHDLREKTTENCGVILAGMPYFKSNLEKDARRGKEGVSEFLRRVNVWTELHGLTPNEGEYIARNCGITDDVMVRSLALCPTYGELQNELLEIKAMEETSNDEL